jgi:tetratricopeptide (TPR) repeat protein
MKKQLFFALVFLLIDYTAFCQTIINRDDMEHQMHADRIDQRKQSYLEFEERVANAPYSFNKQGLLAVKEGRYNDALKQFDEAIAMDKTYAEAYYNRGLLKQKMYKLLEAIDDLDAALSLAPGNYLYLQSAAKARYDYGDYKIALNELDKLIRLNKNNGSAFLLHGMAKNKLKKYTEAVEDFSQAIKLSANPAEAYLSRGNTEHDMNKNDAACADWNTAKSMGNPGAVKMISQFCK